MRAIFWNSNGFKDPKKHMFISDLTREQQLCFIAVSETGKKINFSDSVLRNLCGDGFFCGTLRSRGAGREESC
jgi:hypothetical protein